MSRLTKWENEHAVLFDYDYEEMNDKFYADNDVVDCVNLEFVLEKLAEYEDLEDKGLLLKLPCKVGDTVWFVGNDFVNDYEVRRYIIDETGVDCIQIAKEIDGRDYWNSFSIDDFNKTVFLTKEEAEQKLKEMGSD